MPWICQRGNYPLAVDTLNDLILEYGLKSGHDLTKRNCAVRRRRPDLQVTNTRNLGMLSLYSLSVNTALSPALIKQRSSRYRKSTQGFVCATSLALL